MADNQTLAVLQEILLKSRIKFVTGTEAEWTAANPVLLDGEYGLIRGSSPLKYKVGDGTKTWSALGWGNVTSLAPVSYTHLDVYKRQGVCRSSGRNG